jgi:serine/threonine protein kinase
MEMMSKNLTGLIREHAGPLPEPLILKVALGIAKGLQFLHQSKPRIIHRDLKPDNILVQLSFS